MRKKLSLTIHKKWFDLILSGEKKIEYREYKPYWIKRLSFTDNFSHVMFRNGYNSTSPWMIVEVRAISLGVPKPDWPHFDHEAEWEYAYLIHLGNVVEYGNLDIEQAILLSDRHNQRRKTNGSQ